MGTAETACRSILTRTGGFLAGFTHTLNPYRGCAYGGSLCGVACYAPALLRGARAAEPWGSFLEAKTNAADAYRADLPRERRRGPVRIFMSSVTDPYVPQERRLRITRAVLEAMADEPPDRLALQTHTPGPLRDLDLLRRIPCAVQITVETDRASIPGLPPHAFRPAERIAALAEVRRAGLRSVGVVAPLLPLDDAQGFARSLERACDFVILDHWRIGDGSREGARTRRRGLPDRLDAAGLGSWNRLEALHETAELFRRILGPERVGISAGGFNA